MPIAAQPLTRVLVDTCIAGTWMVVLLAPACLGAEATAVPATAPAAPPSRAEIADLRQQVEKVLVEQVMRASYPLTVARQRGGFHQNVARTGPCCRTRAVSWSTRRG